MSLAARIADRIRSGGPMSVAEYMHVCLHDPRDGYYATRPALSAEGDFITAPLVSQVFGELIGLWMVELWRQMGRPAPVRLVELGPGDGTLMSDLLRAAGQWHLATGRILRDGPRRDADDEDGHPPRGSRSHGESFRMAGTEPRKGYPAWRTANNTILPTLFSRCRGE